MIQTSLVWTLTRGRKGQWEEEYQTSLWRSLSEVLVLCMHTLLLWFNTGICYLLHIKLASQPFEFYCSPDFLVLAMMLVVYVLKVHVGVDPRPQRRANWLVCERNSYAFVWLFFSCGSSISAQARPCLVGRFPAPCLRQSLAQGDNASCGHHRGPLRLCSRYWLFWTLCRMGKVCLWLLYLQKCEWLLAWAEPGSLQGGGNSKRKSLCSSL